MQKIKIAYVDFWKGMVPEEHIFTKILKKHYDVEITKQNPDFVFCSTFGQEYLTYDCPRILFVGEAFCPDFNLYDYAIGFDHMNFGDRYLRYPLCLMDRENMKCAIDKVNRPREDYLNRTGFCSFVVSSGGGVGDLRTWYFEQLSQYKQVSSGGRYRNNLPDGQPVADKKAFQEKYRFSLAFENTRFPGYVTEKLIDAWAAGTIPIYCGDPLAIKDFNEKAFINCSCKEDYEKVLQRIKEIETNQELYLQMMKEPIFLPGSEMEMMVKEEYLENFLLHIVGQEPAQAIRRNAKLTMWGQFYEYRMIKWNKMDHLPIVEFFRRWKRKLFGLKKIG